MTSLKRSCLIVILITMEQHICADNIELASCPPPDYPANGGYGPIQPSYSTGDGIHYFCNTYSYIGGNYYRLCLDTGDWSGETPVCDFPVVFTEVSQTSTAEPAYKNEADMASDGSKSTCSSTEVGPNNEWIATFPEVSHVLRVMLFLPRGEASYEIFVVRPDGSEFSCGGSAQIVERYEWVFHNCLEPNNTDPTCVDPHVFVENGRLLLSRKEAVLHCDPGFTKSREKKLVCLRTGVWTRKSLYCQLTEREVEIVGPSPNRNEEVGSPESVSFLMHD